MSKTVNLGRVVGKSAYEQAKEGGYTGTEAEFNAQMANPMTEEKVDERVNAYLTESTEIVKTKDLITKEVYSEIELTVATSGQAYKINTTDLVDTTLANSCELIAVSEGEKYKISGKSSWGVILFNMLDSSKAFVSSYPNTAINTATYTDYEFEIPSGVSYLAINTFNSSATALSVLKSEYVTETLKSLENTVSALINPTNPLESLIEGAGFLGCFDTITCIGDSLTKGVFDRTNGASMDYDATAFCSYPSHLARITGATVYNCGLAGATAMNSETSITDLHSWLYNNDTFKWLSEENKSKVYIIALGTNDIGYYDEFTGEIANINTDDMTQTDTTTSVGGYGYIIQKIREIQPNAKIFCVTIPNTRNGATARVSANEKIRAIAELLSCYVIDLEKYGTKSTEVTVFKEMYYNGGHLNALGYKLHAQRIITYIDYIIRNNYADFQNIQFIGTDMDYSN